MFVVFHLFLCGKVENFPSSSLASFISTQLSRSIDTYSNQYSASLCDPYYYLLTFQLIVVSPPSISALATLVLYSTTLDHIEP